MKKILLRAGMSPLVNYNPVKVILRNMMGTNIGNMLFQSSVSRALMCGGDTADTKNYTIIDTVNTARKYSREHIRQINENYDCLVLPFANAFRDAFIDELDAVTRLVKKVKIPCIVVGIGMQADLDTEVGHPDLDRAVIDFMKAILKKSATVGLRGEVTADYLTKLGFQAERDFTVVGCPSMYMYGKELPEMEVKELTPSSRVSMNSKVQLPQKFHDFMYRCGQEIPGYCYVPQVIEEINQMFMGKGYPPGFVKEMPKHFPVSFANRIYKSGRGVTFTNLPSWLRYLSEKDFSFGSRIHGNIASILAGTPSFVVVSDKRIMELVEYHNIPHIMMQDLKSNTSIFDLYNKADFTAMRKNQERNFMHYLDFLKENGLQTIFDEDGNAPEDCLFDMITRKVKFSSKVKAFSALKPDKQIKRLRAIYGERRRLDGYYKEKSTGVAQSFREWRKYELKGDPTPNYQKTYPFIREYNVAKKAEQEMNNMEYTAGVDVNMEEDEK